jgi:hypothetical protein
LIYLTFHHHSILVRSSERSLLQKIKEEFHFFHVDQTPKTSYVVDLFLTPTLPEIPEMVASKILEHVTIYQNGESKYLEYPDKSLTIWSPQNKKIDIFSDDISRLYELSFLCIHSVLGQELEVSGICRLHALGITIGQMNAIVMLPSRGGKSTLLQDLISDPEVKIISDDMPLCDYYGNIYPFPAKISLDKIPDSGPLSSLQWNEFKRFHYPPKWTLSLSQIKERISINSHKKKNILIHGLRISKEEGHILKVPKWKMIKPMMEHMIIGMGLPQILEMFLNFNYTDMLKLIYHGLIRTICALNLVRSSKCYYLYLGTNKALNAKVIRNILYDYQNQ